MTTEYRVATSETKRNRMQITCSGILELLVSCAIFFNFKPFFNLQKIRTRTHTHTFPLIRQFSPRFYFFVYSLFIFFFSSFNFHVLCFRLHFYFVYESLPDKEVCDAREMSFISKCLNYSECLTHCRSVITYINILEVFGRKAASN